MTIPEEYVNTHLEIYGNLNAALIPSSESNLKPPKDNTMDLSNFNAESPEDWACRFYWECYFKDLN